MLWKHFGSTGNSAFDNRFEAELAACTAGGHVFKFYHGTSWKVAQKILGHGFIESSDGLLGKGIYVAREDKAMRFAKNKNRHKGQHGGLVELRVTVRKPKFVSSNDNSWQKEGYDACRAERTTLSSHMEWCIKDRDQVQVIGISKVQLSPEGAQNQLSSRVHTRGSMSAGKKAKKVCIGKVTKWFKARGFGFIRPNDSSEDIFAHLTQIVGANNALVVGRMVNFTRVFNAKRGKFQATKISGEGCTHAPAQRQFEVNFQRSSYTHGVDHHFHHGMHLPPSGTGSEGQSGNGMHVYGHYDSAHIGEGGVSGVARSYGGYGDTYIAGMNGSTYMAGINGSDMGACSHTYNNGAGNYGRPTGASKRRNPYDR